MTDCRKKIAIALAWCLAWGDKSTPQYDLAVLQEMRLALHEGRDVPHQVKSLVEQVHQLQSIEGFPDQITDLQDQYPALWSQTTPIGLVYGGATKIKGYVFESANLQEIRGASAILDRINILDLPGFFGEFGENNQGKVAQDWLNQQDNLTGLADALIPELIIYSTGGNILAFCPAYFIDDLSNAIEKRYTQETITANSCAVGHGFRLLEMRFGLLQQDIEKTNWLDWYQQHHDKPIVQAYYGKSKDIENFKSRKSFNELAGLLAAKFNHRRNGNYTQNRHSRSYPPILETHPYLVRDGSDRASAIVRTTYLPNNPYFSEPLARKRLVGQKSKREAEQYWYERTGLKWQPGEVESWVKKFEQFLQKHPEYLYNSKKENVEEARSLEEIGNNSNGFVAFIYADGNNMGGYIQKIKTPEEYQQFSKDIFEATEESVYHALGIHLQPHQLNNLRKKESKQREGKYVHPFEIITIGGDDVLLIVPANQALAIAKTIGEEFEKRLAAKEAYQLSSEQKQQQKITDTHRYSKKTAPVSECSLSMSAGVLMIGYDTPIYYAEKLTNELLKSAKKKAKYLKKEYSYYGGTIDFLSLKSVTMISSNIEGFREQALVKNNTGKAQLKLYGAPYTLHEVDGLIKTVQALKEARFPRSQLYQIRRLLERGKKTAMLNYRYFRVRLQPQEAQTLLESEFEKPWCEAKCNNGNLAPWMSSQDKDKTIYETIWTELVDIYPFVEEEVRVSRVG